MAAIFTISSFMGKKSPTKGGKKQFVEKKRMSLLTDKVEKDMWVAAEGQNIKALEKSNDELRGQMDQLRREMNDSKAETLAKDVENAKSADATKGDTKDADAEKDKDAIKPRNEIPPLPSAKKPAVDNTKPPIPSMKSQLPPADEGQQPPQTQTVGEVIGTIMKPPGKQTLQQPRPGPGQGGGNQKASQEEASAIRMFKDDSPNKTENSDTNKKKKQPKGTWLPSGSFMKAVMLNGIDAPTSSGAKGEPYPVLLTVTDMSNLPNRFRMNLRECFIIGAGYGNLSDERAYIRTETLSCVTTSGQSIDVPLKGQVVGGDGKLGVRGRLVSKQGQKIAMAIFAGTIGGLGNALKPQQAVSLNLGSSSGVTQPSVGDVAMSAGMGGAGNALNKVADYYLKMAETLFPIIEIDAGRPVEIIILKGQELAIQDK